jgi:glyoxylase-like metal-dependent hydrolase (beta-lactamase superfamily II)
MAPLPHHEIIAFKFASSPVRQAWQNYLQPDPDQAAQSLDFLFFAIRDGDKVVLVDTGFSSAAGRRKGLEVDRAPTECLREVGIAPSDIGHVIVSHLHWDHAGCLEEFEGATFHLQQEELAFATGPCMCEPLLRRPFDAEDVAAAVRLLYAGRLRLHEGEATIAPGITLHRIAGHTRGLQAVRVSTARGWVVLACDGAHLWQNLRRRNPFPVLVDVEEVLRGYDTLQALADGADHIIPGHDPLVVQRFPAVPGAHSAVFVHLAPVLPLD